MNNDIYEFRQYNNRTQKRKIGKKNWHYICVKENCQNMVMRLTQKYCATHNGIKKCIYIDEFNNKCNKNASTSGNTNYCGEHGGTKRCLENNCNNYIRKGNFCPLHGGLKRTVLYCNTENCNNIVVSNGLCIRHGALKKQKKKCNTENCNNFSISNGLCISCGGGPRCQSERCSIFEPPPPGYYKYNGQYLCNYCFYQIYPEAKSNKLFIRQEHLVLAEIQRLIEDDLNAISCIWDCPIKCSLKVPDLMYELDDIYVSFEVDENGHDQPIERILEFRNILDKPFIMFRINPNLAEKSLLKKNRLSNGESVWKATEHFEPLMNEFKNIVLEEIDNIRNRDNNNDLPCYTEVGFLFNKYPNDRGNIIENNYGYIVYS